MKKIKLFVICLITLVSCKSDEISVNKLVGEWSHTNMYKSKDSNGKWGEWYTLINITAMPTLGFTANGKILSGGKISESCCSFKSYELNDNLINLTEPGLKGCATALCYPCNPWTIAKLTTETLEIEFCNSAVRYTRVKK